MDEQAHVYYSGQVQGVGFRYRAQRIACGFKVNGWVRNLPDGRVELLVQGSSQQVKAFLSELDSRLDMFISGKQDSWGSPDSEYENKGFYIDF